MLKEFKVHNFKLLLNVSYRPAKLNLLLGKNNTGKTSLCQALKFLGLTARIKINDCIKNTTLVPFALPHNALLYDPIQFNVKANLPLDDHTYAFDYQVSFRLHESPQQQYEIKVEDEFLFVTGGNYYNKRLLANTDEKVLLLHEQNDSYVETHSPRDATMLYRLYDLHTNRLANHFKKYLSSWWYYSLNVSQIRTFQAFPDSIILIEDGSNLATMLHRLKNINEHEYRKVLSRVGHFDPSIDAMNFSSGAESILWSFADARNNPVLAHNSSDGTLRYLALLYLLTYQINTFGRSSFVMIEEPENGIFAGQLKDIIELATAASEHTQILFTSHSPYFIDYFDSRLDGLFLMERDESHAEVIQPDMKTMKRNLELFPLGELHRQSMLK